MIETGEVVRSSKGTVDVRIVPTEHCAECGACAAVSAEAMIMRDVADPVGARLGDTVEVEVPEGSRLHAALIGYAVPVGALAGGYLAGRLLAVPMGADPDTVGAVAAVVAVAATFLRLRSRGRSVMAAERYHPRVRAIIRRGAVP